MFSVWKVPGNYWSLSLFSYERTVQVEKISQFYLASFKWSLFMKNLPSLSSWKDRHVKVYICNWPIFKSSSLSVWKIKSLVNFMKTYRLFMKKSWSLRHVSVKIRKVKVNRSFILVLAHLALLYAYLSIFSKINSPVNMASISSGVNRVKNFRFEQKLKNHSLTLNLIVYANEFRLKSE